MTITTSNSLKNQKAALGFEPRITVLQTAALPLGYAAINPVRKRFDSEPKPREKVNQRLRSYLV